MATKMVEVNCATGEIIEREMTKEEISVEKKLQDEAAAQQTVEEIQAP